MEQVTPILAPDKALMQQHLELLFGRALSGRVEITGISTRDDARPKVATQFFDLDNLDGAIDYAAELNAEPGRNVYVGAALRRPDVFPGKAADDSDFLRTYVLWADADDGDQVASARETYHRLGVTPPFVVVTGRAPSKRAQLWWPLENPIEDIAVLRASLRGIVAELKTDPKVCTGKQLMRLAGGVNWPKKEGRVLERTEVVQPPRAAREFTLDHMHRAFPPMERHEVSAAGIADVEVARVGALGLEEKVMDGREAYAFKLVRSHLREWIGTTGSDPTPDELYKSVAPVYLRKADQVRPGRGPEFLKQKCAEAVRAFHAGQIPGLRSLEEGVQTWAARQRGERVEEDPLEREFQEDDANAGNSGISDDLFEVLSIADLKALPEAQWLIKDAIPAAGLGFIYGPPGSYKSFVCYDLALTLAYAQPTWIEREIKPRGSVLYIANEGSAGASNRIAAWQRKHGHPGDSDGFHLIRQSMSFMEAGDIDRLERTVSAHVADKGAVGIVFVDTVSRVLPGADENLQKDMTVFVAACDRLRERFGATVVGVHHTNKNGDMRGSTVFLGQGDFVFRVEKDSERKAGVLSCEKQKEAEDGWEVAFKVDEVEWVPEGRVEAVSSLTIDWTGKPEPQVPQDAKWPPRETLKAMQRAIQDAFVKGQPLAMTVQSKASGRYAPDRLATVFDVKPVVIVDVLTTWLNHQVVEVREADKHSKARGMEVVKWLD